MAAQGENRGKPHSGPGGGNDDHEPVVVPIEDTIDLHTFCPGDVKVVLKEYLQACQEKGLLEVRVIHGKGKGALAAGVRAFLERSPLVEGFAPARPEEGGWGAVIVRLKPPG